MEYPKMILFDYGHTLMCEPDYDPKNGERKLFEYVKTNKYNLTADEVSEISRKLTEEIRVVRQAGYELNESQFHRFLYEYCGIELSLSFNKAEQIFWDGMSGGAVMPGTHELLSYLNENGIRTGVISNIMFTENALTERLNRFFPENRFEFIITSSEYIFRKPNPLLFELALRKAGLPASDVWYCGDNPQADVMGSAGVGIYPVWYDNDLECLYRDKTSEPVPTCEYLHIHEWDEMISKLEGMK